MNGEIVYLSDYINRLSVEAKICNGSASMELDEEDPIAYHNKVERFVIFKYFSFAEKSWTKVRKVTMPNFQMLESEDVSRPTMYIEIIRQKLTVTSIYYTLK